MGILESGKVGMHATWLIARKGTEGTSLYKIAAILRTIEIVEFDK